MKRNDAVQRPKSFPGRLKGFVKDVRTLTKDLRHRDRKDSIISNTSTESLVLAEEVAESQPQSQPHADLPDLRDASYVTDLAVQVSLSFEEPLDFSYSRSYEASPSLKATDQLCQGLLGRVDHCSQELITRKDRNALDRTGSRGTGNGKPLRYEIEVQIIREGEIWATRTYRSYQKQPLTASAAHEVTMATHYMVGLYLRHHDNGFVWKDGPVRDDPSIPLETFPYRPARVQPMSCIPRYFFLEKTQEFESTPGFTISLDLTSCSPHHRPAELRESLEIHSNQMTPLHLTVAENSFFEATFVLEELLRSERKTFRKTHSSCEKSGGCKTCRSHEGDKLEVNLTVSNNLGPQYSHLERTVLSHSSLFCHPQGQDFHAFVKKVEYALGRVRDESDDTMNNIDDLEFRISELRAKEWTLDEPIVFKIGAENAHSRRNVEGILERIQTSVADILKGNAMTVRMTAIKRGHTILDKTLVAKEPTDPNGPGRKRSMPLAKPKTQVLASLRKKIQRDIEIVCQDTCTIGDSEDDAGDALKTLDPMPEPDVNEIRPIPRLAATPFTMAKKGSDVSTEPRSESGIVTVNPANDSKVSTRGSNRPTISSQPSSNFLETVTNSRISPLVSSEQGKSEKGSDVSAPLSTNATPTDQAFPKAGSTASISKSDLSSQASHAKSNKSVPSTPSLTYGENSSPRSSLLITPQSHQAAFGSTQDSQPKTFGQEKLHCEDEAALDTITEVKSPAPQKAPDYSMPNLSRLDGAGPMEAEPKKQAVGASSKGGAAKKPAFYIQSHQEEESSDSDSSDDFSQIGQSTNPKLSGQGRARIMTPTSDDMSLPVFSTDEFSRSKPDFDLTGFSDDTPGGSQMGLEDIMARNKELTRTPKKSSPAQISDPHTISESAIDDNVDDDENSPVTPGSLDVGSDGLPKRKSFSSAGFLGFREGGLRMDQTRLRKALGGGGSGTPSSPSSSPPRGEKDASSTVVSSSPHPGQETPESSEEVSDFRRDERHHYGITFLGEG